MYLPPYRYGVVWTFHRSSVILNIPFYMCVFGRFFGPFSLPLCVFAVTRCFVRFMLVRVFSGLPPCVGWGVTFRC